MRLQQIDMIGFEAEKAPTSHIYATNDVTLVLTFASSAESTLLILASQKNSRARCG